MEDLDISELDSLDKMDVTMIFNQYLYALITNLNTLVKDEDILYFSNVYNDVIKANQSFSSSNFEVGKLMRELLNSYNFILKKCYVALDEIHTKEDRSLLAKDLIESIKQLEKIHDKI